MNSDSHKLAIISFVLLGLTAFAVALVFSQFGKRQDIRSRAAPSSVLFFNPGTLTVVPGQTFSLDAKINPGTNVVTGAEIYISYDPAKLTINSISNSPVFPTVLRAVSINNLTGLASIIVGTSITSPVTTTSTIVTVNFAAKSTTGQVTVSYATGTRVAAYNENGSAVAGLQPANITIAAAPPTPTPRPSPTPTPTPRPTATPTPTPRPTLTPTPTPTPTLTPTPTPSFIPGDINHNGTVDIFDFNLLVQNFSKTGCGNIADINGDCVVNIYDFNILYANFGKTR